MASKSIKKPTNIYELLDSIHLRSGMYLRKSDSLSALEDLINGYLSCIISNRIIEKHEALPFQYFSNFINQKYNSSGISWCDVITMKNEDTKAFEHFFELLEEFKQIRPISVKKAILTEFNVNTYLVRLKEGNRETIILPDAIYIIEFSHDFGFDDYWVKDDKMTNSGFRYSYETSKTERGIKKKLENQFGKIKNWETLQSDLIQTMEYLMKIK